jgi:hypothetical protein
VWRYLKAAFLCRVPVPALGEVPANVLGVIALGALGFADAGFWFLGAGLETLFLYALSSNPRFQKVVDARALAVGEVDADQKRRELIHTLPAPLQSRLGALGAKCRRAQEVIRNQQSEEFVIEANQDALQRLQWVFLKLLVAQNNLLANTGADSESALRTRIASLEADLQKSADSGPLRQSKSATLAILKERLANIGRRAQSLEEIESDLTRIEAQVDLMLENASIQGKPQAIGLDIELATNLAGASVFGDSEATVADLEQAYSRPHQFGSKTAERN